MPNKEFLDTLAALEREAFGWTKAEAHAALVCIKCREPAYPKCHTKAGVQEYVISGMCEECFDTTFKDQ